MTNVTNHTVNASQTEDDVTMPAPGLYPVIDAEQTVQMIEKFCTSLAEATDKQTLNDALDSIRQQIVSYFNLFRELFPNLPDAQIASGMCRECEAILTLEYPDDWPAKSASLTAASGDDVIGLVAKLFSLAALTVLLRDAESELIEVADALNDALGEKELCEDACIECPSAELREEWEELSARVYVAQEHYECSVWAVEDLQSQINRVMNPTVETAEA